MDKSCENFIINNVNIIEINVSLPRFCCAQIMQHLVRNYIYQFFKTQKKPPEHLPGQACGAITNAGWLFLGLL